MCRILLSSILVLLALSWQPSHAQCTDLDGDGFFYEGGCGTERDCNDGDPTTYPDGAEACDGFDNDCDAVVDNDCAGTCSVPDLCDGVLQVSDTPNRSLGADLVWTGNSFGLTFADEWAGQLTWRIFFALLNDNATDIDSFVAVSDPGADSLNPSLVWTGSYFGVVWDQNGARNIVFNTLDSVGQIAGAGTVVSDDPDSFSLDPALVWTGNHFGVAWWDNRDANEEIYFALVDSTGARLGADQRTTAAAGASRHPSLVWSGAEFGLAWRDNRDGNQEVYFARLAGR